MAAAVAFAVLAVPASADDHQQSTYLALGDSYAFAFNPSISLAGRLDPANFPGYTNAVASALDLHLTNAACPGETSGSFISGTLPDNGCQAWRSNFPLHVSYTGSQLAYAVKFLRSHHHVDLVTLQIGGNDILTLQALCHKDVTCIIKGLPAVETQMAANLKTIYLAIRHRAHYHGVIVTVPYFAFNYNDPNMVAISSSLDGVVAAVATGYHARVADVFDAFKAASAPSGIPCFAGLQVPTPSDPTSPCDIHPSAAGHAVFTKAILAVLPDDNNDNNEND
ncbi:MAG TPA: SGNH/GDSL hydrolase family protein [Candidatus Dormibacteraeota bacterium]|nr:SGNH/GDSL hydrolase family protein [Candidatus Dormibacteraeota bacterium]